MSTARLTRRGALLTLAALCGTAAAQPLPGSFENWRRLFGGPQLAADEAERMRLLAEGEARLQAGEALAAQDAFQRAAMLMHAPDTECSIVRAQMQAGQYRQALAFAAHAALAHRGFAGGVALYAWLLHLGGQSRIAARLLDEALQRHPADAALQAARDGLAQPWPEPAAALQSAPLRAAPYAHGDAPEASEAPLRCAGSATLLPDGITAFVPLATLAGREQCHVRDGLGRTQRARLVERRDAAGVARIELARRVPVPEGIAQAARAPFAGSPLAVVEFGASAAGEAAWPQLVQGFAGTTARDGTRRLGVELSPGARGGPVFERSGRLAGMALPGAGGPDRLWTFDPPGPAAPAAPSEAAPVDAIYEAALQLTLQVLVPSSQ